MVTDPGPKKKPKVLMTYVGKKTTEKKEKETPPKKMRGQITPLSVEPQAKPQQE